MNALGEALGRCRAPYVPFSANDGVNRWTHMTLELLGDPELRMFTGPPRTLQVTHAPVVFLDDATIGVDVAIGGSSQPNAPVAAWRGGEFLGIAITNGAGHAVVPIDPQTIGSFVLTVTAYDARPYEAGVQILTPPTATLFSQVRADAYDDRSVVAGQVSGGGAEVIFERASDSGRWREIARMRSDGTGRVRWDDREIGPETNYRYRLGLVDGSAVVYSPEVGAVSRPRPVLSVRVSGPLPASGPIHVEFVLVNSSPAQIELMDVRGRRLGPL